MKKYLLILMVCGWLMLPNDSNAAVTYKKMPTPSVTKRSDIEILGDANKDGKVDLVDFSIWKYEYNLPSEPLTSPNLNWTADFNNDTKVDLVDFSIWKQSYLNKLRY